MATISILSIYIICIENEILRSMQDMISPLFFNLVFVRETCKRMASQLHNTAIIQSYDTDFINDPYLSKT